MKKQVIFWLLIMITKCVYAQSWNNVGLGMVGGGPTSLNSFEKLYIGVNCSGTCNFSGVPVDGIVTLSGNDIDTLGSGVFGYVNDAAWFNGKLIVGGNIFCADIPPDCIPFTQNIAAWDSLTGWSSITPSGGTNTNIQCMEVYNNEIYIGGMMTTVDGISCNRMAKYNGTSWSDVGGGVNGSFEDVKSMAIYHGQLYVGGDFVQAGSIPAYFIARWNGVQWDTVGSGLNYYVWDMTVDSINDVLYVCGGFTLAGGVPANGVAMWNDTVWSAVGTGTDTLWGTHCLSMFNGQLFAGGGNVTITAAGDTINNVYKFDGIKWTSVDGGASSDVEEMCVYNGNLYIGGYFSQVGYGIPANRIACYGTTCPIGVGISEPPKKIPFSMFPNPNEDVLHITTAEPGQLVLKIFSNSGQLVNQQTFIGQIDFETGTLAAGSYTVQVSLEDGSRMHSEVLIVK